MSELEENSLTPECYVTVEVDMGQPDITLAPAKKTKLDVEVEIENDMAIPCRLCAKTFANPTAIRNHVRVLHMGSNANVEDWLNELHGVMMTSSPVKIKQEPLSDPEIERRTNEILASMKPFNMTELVSNKVKYVIVKAEDFGTTKTFTPVKRKRQSIKKETKKEIKEKVPKSQAENVTDPISGPFECLQPAARAAGAGACHQIFFSCCEYSLHYRDEHTRRRKAPRCQVCEKLLSPADGQEPDSPYMCQVCGEGFATHGMLAEHTSRQHVKLKPYQCGTCGRRFTQQGGLLQHQRAHRGERPFPCSFCSKAFTQKSGLDQHLRTHTKVKPYRCVICHKTFCQSVHLKQHMRTHTNVTPFQCAICEKKFKQSSHLNYHLKNHTEANMTDDQKKKYHELIGLLQQQHGITNVVSVDDDGQGFGDGQGLEEEVVVEEDRGYILSDNGDETWTVIVDEGVAGQHEQID